MTLVDDEMTRDALVLGITVLTGDPIRDALRASREVKQSRPDLPIVWGGWHPSLFPQQTLDEKSVDVTVQGQGELTFRELVERFAAGKGLRDLQGIHYRDADGCRVANPPRPLASI